MTMESPIMESPIMESPIMESDHRKYEDPGSDMELFHKLDIDEIFRVDQVNNANRTDQI